MDLTISNLSFHYEGKAILSDFSLFVKSGETLSLLGPSGCGKSTLLKLILGKYQPSYGTILLGNHPVPYENKIAAILSETCLFPWMTVEENLRLVADDLSVKQCMEELEMTSWSSYYPSSISAGMTQKVKIARLSLLPAEVWLLDEPFNGLDLHSKEVVQMFLKKHQNGRTVILVTHNPKEAVSMSERIIFWDTQKMRPDAEWCSHDDIEQLVTYMLQETTSKERQ